MNATLVTALTALSVALLTLLGVMYTARQNSVAARLQATATREAAEVTAQGQLTDDQREEITRLSADLRTARSEMDELRFKVRTITEYAELCIKKMRRAGLDPPPVPVAIRHPWEGSP